MTGKTVKVNPPAKDKAGLQGIASVDNNKQQARILVGGTKGNTDVVINGLDELGYFKGQVHVKVWSTEWTGQKGASNGPNFELEGNYPIVDGQATVKLPELKLSSAYQLLITANDKQGETQEVKQWTESYQAEKAEITNAKIYNGGYFDGEKLIETGKNYNSNGQRVGYIDKEDSQVEFSVEVPQDGTYHLDIFYGNGHGQTAEQLLQVDNNEWRVIEYPAAIAWEYFRKKSIKLELSQGSHTISFAKYDPSVGKANLSIDLDKIDLTHLDDTSSGQRYEAEYSRLSGGTVIRRSEDGYSGTGYVKGYFYPGAKNEFIINAAKNGYYNVKVKYSAGPCPNKEITEDRNLELKVNNLIEKEIICESTASWDQWREVEHKVFLSAGINSLSLSVNDQSGINVDYIEVEESQGAVASYEAESEQNELGGTALIQSNQYASAGKYVGELGAGAENSLKFNKINVEQSGAYKMVVHYANAERESGHMYNVDIVDRAAQISVNGTAEQEIYFRNTFSWDNYRTTVVDLQLEEGDNTILFSNDNSYAPNIDKIEIYKTNY